MATQTWHLQIGALKEIKRELVSRRRSLMKAMITETERLVFENLSSRLRIDTTSAETSKEFESNFSTPSAVFHSML